MFCMKVAERSVRVPGSMEKSPSADSGLFVGTVLSAPPPLCVSTCVSPACSLTTPHYLHLLSTLYTLLSGWQTVLDYRKPLSE